MMRGPGLRRLRSAIRTGLRGPRARPLVFLLSVSSMAAGLLLLATYLLLVQNMRQVLDRFGGDLRLVAFLEPEISSQADRVAELRARLEVLPGVVSLEFVDAEQALEILRDELGREASVLEGLEGNPLPASFQIHVAADARSPEAMHSLAGQLAESAGVADVRYGEEWVAAYARILRALIWLGAGLGVFLVLALGTIVAGAVRLGVHARADEIQIQRLVGAGSLFVRLPFYLEAGLQGGLAAGVALGILYGLVRIGLPGVGDLVEFLAGRPAIEFLGPAGVAGFCLLGIGIGVAAAALSLVHLEDSPS